MSWLNSVLATPVLGIRIEPNINVALKYPQLIAPLLEEINKKSIPINLTSENTYNVSVQFGSGFVYSLIPTDLVVEFKYSLKHKKRAGGFPTLEAVDVQPYDTLLSASLKDMQGLLRALIKEHPIYARRVGVMARADLEKDSLPPGVEELLGYLSKPWKKPLIKCETNLLAELKSTDELRDQCHHMIQFDETQGKEFSFSLDWQRLLKSPVKIDETWIGDVLPSLITEARNYFKKTGEEGFGDE
jgi:hypothetical protein